MADIAPRRWRMHASYNEKAGVFMHFGHPRYVELYGCRPVPVAVAEDPEGRYWGWLPAGGGDPEMVQPHKGMFDVQFAYGPEAEERRGRGTVVRLTVEADPDV